MVGIWVVCSAAFGVVLSESRYPVLQHVVMGSDGLGATVAVLYLTGRGSPSLVFQPVALRLWVFSLGGGALSRRLWE